MVIETNLKAFGRNHFVLLMRFRDLLVAGAEKGMCIFTLASAEQQCLHMPGFTAEGLTCRGLQTVSSTTVLANYICVCVQCILQVYFLIDSSVLCFQRALLCDADVLCLI